ncbi:EAL domain-containing protein [Pseudaestuariivita atlantica]|uniref:Diguanylate phosphodiesterase n=1 Tax=Pseudaestuariivita atlantica TaxID=1317121 RepID=A0A0L1JRT1_9RHOB|nr:EAL domain-containing protein [Pseudaestuariivita atlantica]KNG94431.1 diguanylate phosphodiesterase [Pseudaestuariivita atlantica]
MTEVNPLAYAVAKRDSETLTLVKDAIKHRQVHLAFQPVVQTKRQTRVAFYEALIRVEDAMGRIIAAADFIPAIEAHETGRILDCLALENALLILGENPGLRLSVNMSARSIGYRNWVNILDRALTRDPSLGARLILEITESSAMTVPELVVEFMREFQGRDVAFALDDFGSGYTSFRYFRDFQFDILKIDGEFVNGIAKNPDNEVLTRALHGVGQHFDMFTVAEKVENAEDVKVLEEIGIDCLQGFFFGAATIQPPWMPEEDQQSA